MLMGLHLAWRFFEVLLLSFIDGIPA